MSLFTNFFKESDTQLGVFYPNHYLIAVFRSLETAQQAVKKLRLAGFAEDEVIAAAGQDFIALAKEETGLGSFLMQALSRFFATEQMSHDSDLDLAQHGAAFVAVHCPHEKTKKEAWNILKRSLPWQLGTTPMTESSTWQAISLLIKVRLGQQQYTRGRSIVEHCSLSRCCLNPSNRLHQPWEQRV